LQSILINGVPSMGDPVDPASIDTRYAGQGFKKR